MYKIEEIVDKVIQGDCLEVMKEMPDKCVDLVVTSPPYNTGNKSLGYHPKSATGDNFYDEYEDDIGTEEYATFIFKTVEECIRVSRYVFWNMQMLSNNKDVIVELQSRFRKHLKDIFIWEKQAVSQIVQGRMAKGYEFVFMFGENDNVTFEKRNFPENSYLPNIKTFYKKGKDAIPEHHATFPKDLVSYFIQYFTSKGDVVLDPFLGSGTTAVAAKQLNRNFIGIEVSEKYCDIARRRIAGVTPPLFVSQPLTSPSKVAEQ